MVIMLRPWQETLPPLLPCAVQMVYTTVVRADC